MSRTALLVIVCLVFVGSRSVAAKPVETMTQNEFITAEALDAGLSQSGVHLTMGERYQDYYPAFRYGVGGLFEVGAKFGVATAGTGRDDKVAGLIGLDVKLQLVKQTEGVPVDMAVDLGFDTHILSGRNISEVTFSTIFSRGIPLTEKGYKASPYGGLELSVLSGSYLHDRETDYYIFCGTEWRFTQKSMLYVELKTGDHTLGGIGVRFEY